LKLVNLPIFPLKLVVLPGTIQGLQIFETRYLNMVKQCMSNGSNFVISYKSDRIDDFDFGIERVGTSVQIIDFNNLPNGLLGITVKAISKVSLNNIIQLEDKSYLGEVSPLTEPEVDDQSLLAKYPDLIEVLVKLKEHPEIRTLQLDIDLDSADSVSYHLGNLIPLTPDEKQTLLTAFDADQRFKILSKILELIRKT
tara:strand:+ start:2515 stop:3105 length:591 start_codon:yes stop_codon:yes gene_type:complete